MCTLSWLPASGAYSIWFNRDERLTRAAALSPNRHERSGVSFLAPTDGEAGGTWIGVNMFGITVCLANRYGSSYSPPAEARVSRGLLVRSVLHLATKTAVAQAVGRAALFQYQPFTMGIFAPASAPLLLAWEGERLERSKPFAPGLVLTSSALNQERVIASRQAVHARALAEEPVSADLLDRLHASHDPERSGLSICMHRSDAATQSLSRIDVGLETIRFRYTPGPPCTVPAEEPLTLPRAAHSPTA